MEALMDPNGPIEVVRIKDRVSEPMDSGYRDVLLNLRIKGIGCDMIMELQLHLRDIIKLVSESVSETLHLWLSVSLGH